jgi:hypothetical protein
VRPSSKQLPINQAVFEAAVIAAVLATNVELADIISNQLANAKIVERWGSGAGFFVQYEVDSTAHQLPQGAPKTLDCGGFAIDGVEAGQGGGHFFHEGGYITELECYGFGNGWPDEKYVFKLFAAPSLS